MRFVTFLQRFIAVAIFVLVTAGAALSQSDRGTIAGTVLDSSGGVVTNASVNATDSETGAKYSATTGPTGGYRLYDLRVGVYGVSVSAPGFKTVDKTGVVVQINTTASLDFSLQPGDVKETLTVIADAPGLQTESSEIGTVVDKRQIQDLPLALNSTGQSHLRNRLFSWRPGPQAPVPLAVAPPAYSSPSSPADRPSAPKCSSTARALSMPSWVRNSMKMLLPLRL